jgi:hypothetical protein
MALYNAKNTSQRVYNIVSKLIISNVIFTYFGIPTKHDQPVWIPTAAYQSYTTRGHLEITRRPAHEQTYFMVSASFRHAGI